MIHNFNNMNNTIIIKFSGIVKDFDGELSQCEWDIPSNPNEKVQDLLSRFLRISGINKGDYRFYINNKSLENYKSSTLSQINLVNNSRIDISYVELESFKDKKSVYIKFIKFSNYSAFNCFKELKGILKLCLLKEIASKIDLLYLDQIYNTKRIPENLYYILKILKESYIEENTEAAITIKKIMEKENGCNIINFSNFVEQQIDQGWLRQVINYVPKHYLNDINDTIFRLGKYEGYIEFFEKEINNSLRNSVFEFSPVSFVILDRQDYDTFEIERRKCPNRCDRILYHGTQIHPISCILTGLFRKSEKSGYQHGKGVYFTDSLDYCWFYGGSIDNRANMNIIPKVGETFTAITNLVYYDINELLKVTNSYTRIQPGKNQVNFAYAASTSETIIEPDPRKFLELNM